MNNKVTNLCPICRYTNKCKRLHRIQKQLSKYIMDVLDDWEINLEMLCLVTECPRYIPDLDDLMQDEDEECRGDIGGK